MRNPPSIENRTGPVGAANSEVVANFSIDGGQLGTCALIDPNWNLTEDFGVVVGHTLVDATTPSASVLIINPNAEEVVLPCGSHIGDLVPVLAVSVARSDLQLPMRMTTVLPDYLEDIVKGSHTSLLQRRYCTTRREMLAAVVMCTHFRSYLRGSQFTLRTDHSSLRWLKV